MFKDNRLARLIAEKATTYNINSMDLSKGLQFYNSVDKAILDKINSTDCNCLEDFFTIRSGIRISVQGYRIPKDLYTKYEHTGLVKKLMTGRSASKGDTDYIMYIKSGTIEFNDIPVELRDILLENKEILYNRSCGAGEYWYETNNREINNKLYMMPTASIPMYLVDIDDSYVVADSGIAFTGDNKYNNIANIVRTKIIASIYDKYSMASKSGTGSGRYVCKMPDNVKKIRIPKSLVNNESVTDLDVANAFGLTSAEFDYLLDGNSIQ